MPELPEVETVRRGLEAALVGKRIKKVNVRRENLRFAFPDRFADRLEGATIERVVRRAKYLLCHLGSGETLLAHLGMTGRFTVFSDDGEAANLASFYFQTGSDQDGLGKHDHVVFDLNGGMRVIYNDPRRFGFMDLVETSSLDEHPMIARLGVEPLGNALNGEFLRTTFKGRKTPLKAALLDQKYIAGLGNIYVCEALFRAGLSPKRRAGTLNHYKLTEKTERLVSGIRDCLNEAIIAGGATLRDFAGADGEKGAAQQRFDVYDREGEPCQRAGCDGQVKRIVQSGRSTFYCPKCQT